MSWDASTWPVLVVTVHRRTDDVTFQQYIALLDELLRRREPQVHVIDIPIGVSMPRSQMQALSHYLQSQGELVKPYLLGTGLVFHSMIHRFGIAAMLSLFRSDTAYQVFGDRGEAVAWGRTLLMRHERAAPSLRR